MSRQALGKGLGALIKNTSENPNTPEKGSKDESSQVVQMPINGLIPSPLQPRKHFQEGELAELVESIRQHGIIQPLITRKVNGQLELIAGERRWRASKELGLQHVPVIEREASDRDVLEMALIENLQRADLDPIEEALGYSKLAKEFGQKQDDIAKSVGKSRASVANAMRLLDLAKPIQEYISKGKLSVGHAKAILSLKEEEAQNIATLKVLEKGLTVRATEKLVAQLREGKRPSDPKNQKEIDQELQAHLNALKDKIQQRFSTHVQITHNEKKGKIEIEYYGRDDLGRVLELLGVNID